MNLVVKIGSSSVTTDELEVNHPVVDSICDQLAELHSAGHGVAVVTSGAIALGLGRLGMRGERPNDLVALQAASAVGQVGLIAAWAAKLEERGLACGQILLSASDFMERRQYLSARATLARMLDQGIVPIINENDAVADDEIRLGDNDRIAALVAGLVGAEVLVLLTDQEGLFTADPRRFEEATLIEEVQEVTRELASLAGGRGTNRGSGGMVTKIMAARIAAWSGVETLIAAASNPDALRSAPSRRQGVGTWIAKSRRRLPSRKLWIAFALPASGYIKVDEGARRAIRDRGSSLLAVGVTEVGGAFSAEEAVEVLAADGIVIAKGLARIGAGELGSELQHRRAGLVSDYSTLAIHRDDMILLEG
ncbi:MAG: glutamate 5-kinase [Actinomycetota bacterium]|nr:glutamate 5-kinase [Actinomycetota bacterium]